MLSEYFDSFKYLTFSLIIVALVLFVVVVTPLRQSTFRRLGSKMPWSSRLDKSLSDLHGSETPMELLAELYTKGEITKNEFDAVKRDLELYVAGKKTKNEFDVVKHDIEFYTSEKSPKNKFNPLKKN